MVALKDVAPHRDRLNGRIVTLEAILIHLLDTLCEARLRCDLEPVRHLDGMLRLCLNPENADLFGCLRSYFLGTVNDVQPLVLCIHRPSPARLTTPVTTANYSGPPRIASNKTLLLGSDCRI